MGIAVLGPLTIEGKQKLLGRRDRVVLAALAVHPGEVVSAESLADVVWGEQPPPSWQDVVQSCVVRLRRILGDDAIQTTPLGYRLVLPRDEIDAQRFERAVSRARRLLAAGDAERSGLVIADALTLWRGRPMADLDGWDVARIETARLTELRQVAEELYVESGLRSGQHERVLSKAAVLVAEEPLRERRWLLLATAQYQAGRHSEALQTLRRLRAVQSRDLGLDPGPDIGALEEAILRQDDSLLAAATLPEPSPVCPYPGLTPYDVDDADEFFGRDADIAACLGRLGGASVLAVVGPSGCGKSSLVRAGVAAALRRDGERVVIITPGVHPVAALAALPGDSPAPVLVVDQAEEVFSLCQDPAERTAFLSALTAHAAVSRLVLALRTDRLADLSVHPEFARLVERGMYLLTVMTDADLRDAIEQPARRSALVVEPGLVDLLVHEVAGRPGALPLMAHALVETWQRREGRTLTIAGYSAAGGIRGAVAQSAEQVDDRVPPEQQASLTDVERDFLAASTRPSEAELRAAEAQARHRLRINRRLGAALGTAAVLVVGALIAGLVAVGQAERADRRAAAAERAITSELALRVGARALLTDGISHSLLLAAQGVRLYDAPETRANLIAAMDRRPQLLRSIPVSTGYVNGFSLTPDGRRMVVGSDRASFQVLELPSGRVVEEHTSGMAQDTQSFAGASYSPDGRMLAVLTSYTSDGPAVRDAEVLLMDAATFRPKLLAGPRAPNLYYHGLTFSADSRFLAVSAQAVPAGEERTFDSPARLYVWDLRSSDRGPREIPLDRGVQGIALSPDGRTVYSQWPLAAYDVATGTQVWSNEVLQGFQSLALSPDGNTVALQLHNADRTDVTKIALVDVRTREARFLEGHVLQPRGLAFSPDGRVLASASQDGEVILWDVATQRIRQRIDTAEASWAVAFSPDGRTLYTGGDEAVIRAYDLSGQQQYVRRAWTLPAAHYAQVLASDDGARTAHVWNTPDGSAVRFSETATGRSSTSVRLTGTVDDGSWTTASWHPGGRYFAVFGQLTDEVVVTVLDAETGHEVAHRAVGPDVATMAFVDGGDRLAVSAFGRTVYLDPRTLLPSGTPLYRPGDCCTAAAPDGETAILFDDTPDGAKEHWRVVRTGTGEVLKEGDLALRVTYAAFSPDGRRVVVTGRGGEVMVIDRETGTVTPALATGHDDEGRFVRFSPDGSRLVSTAADGTVSLWDTSGFDLLGTVRVRGGGPVSAAFAGGNDQVMILGHDGAAYRWDTRVGSMLEYACRMAGRNLAQDEWKEAFGDRPYEQTCP